MLFIEFILALIAAVVATIVGAHYKKKLADQGQNPLLEGCNKKRQIYFSPK